MGLQGRQRSGGTHVAILALVLGTVKNRCIAGTHLSPRTDDETPKPLGVDDPAWGCARVPERDLRGSDEDVAINVKRCSSRGKPLR